MPSRPGAPQQGQKSNDSDIDVPVFVVEPDYFARQWIKLLLWRDPRTRVLGGCSSLPLTPEESKQAGYAQVLLLSGTCLQDSPDPVSRLAGLREQLPGARIVVVVTGDNVIYPTQLLNAGVKGLLVSEEVRDSLASAVARVASGLIVVTQSVPPLLSSISLELTHSLHVLPPPARLPDLADRLREPVYLFTIAGMPAKEIAQERRMNLNTVRKYLQEAHDRLGEKASLDEFRILTALEDEIPSR